MEIDTNPEPDARETSYVAVLIDAARRPFAWGTHDCATFAAACVFARTGVDKLGELSWSTAFEAASLIESMGGLRAAATSLLGEPVEPGFACTGDVVLAIDPNDDDERELLTVAHGTVLLAPAESGLSYIAFDAGICCWRIS